MQDKPFIPALGYDFLTNYYDLTIYRVLKPNGTLVIADWGKAQNLLVRFTFVFVQLLDGFKNTNDNVKGKMSDFIKDTGFKEITVLQSINTIIGTFSYFKAKKR